MIISRRSDLALTDMREPFPVVILWWHIIDSVNVVIVLLPMGPGVAEDYHQVSIMKEEGLLC